MKRTQEKGLRIQGIVGALALAGGLALAEPAPLPVAELKRTDPVNYATEVYPFLRANCLACHNSTKAKADLVLESPKDMLKGGETGPAIVPGKADDSLLFTTAAHIEEPTMPPTNNKSKAKDLNPDQLALLKLWINQGAKGDAVSTAAPESWTLLKGNQPIYSVAISEDGRFAVAGRGQQLHIYDLRLGTLAATPHDNTLEQPVAHLDLVQAVTFSPDGRIASGGYRETKIWERSPASAGTAIALPNEPSALALTTDSKRAAVGASDGSILLMSLDQPDAPPVTIKDHAGAVTGLAFSPDGATLYSVSADKTVKRRTLADPTKAISLPLPAPATSLIAINGGKRLAIAGADQTIRLCAADFVTPPPAAPAPATPAPATPAPAAPTPATPAPATPAPATPAPATPAPATPAPAPAAPPTPAPTPPSPFVELKPHPSPVISLALANAGGTEFLSGHEDGTVVHFKSDPAKAEVPPAEVRRMAHGSPLKQMAVSSTGKLATAGVTGPASLWNLADGKKIVDLKGDPRIQPQIDGLQAESAVATRLKTYWDKQGPEAEKLWQAESEKAKQAGDEIAKTRRDIVVKRAELAKLEAAQPPTKEEDLIKSQEALAAAERALTGAIRNRDLSARLAGDSFAKQTVSQAGSMEADVTIAALKTEVETLQKLIPEQDQKTVTSAVAFSADGTVLAQSLADGSIRLCTAESGVWLEDIAGGGPVKNLAFAGGSHLLTAREGKNLVLWNLPGASWTLAKTLGDGKAPDPFVDRVTALAFNSDGSRLATGTGVPSRSGETRIWDTDSWTALASNPEAHGDSITSFVFSPDGNQLASGSTDRLVRVFNSETLALEKTFEGHTSHVLDVDWNADGLTLASSGADLQVKLWDLAEGQQKQKIEGFEKEVGAVVYVGTSDTLVTASGDKTLKLANAPLPEAGDTFLHTAAASADGKVIVSGGQDGILRIHDATAKKLVKAFPSPEVGPETVAAK